MQVTYKKLINYEINSYENTIALHSYIGVSETYVGLYFADVVDFQLFLVNKHQLDILY